MRIDFFFLHPSTIFIIFTLGRDRPQRADDRRSRDNADALRESALETRARTLHQNELLDKCRPDLLFSDDLA